MSPATSGLLTYVYQLDPMWVNFSISENEILSIPRSGSEGPLKFPPTNEFEVEVMLADGTVFPARGKIDFTESGVQQGDRHVPRARRRCRIPKGSCAPASSCAPGSIGAVRPQAILVPQRAVLQGAKSHYRLGGRQGLEGASARGRSRRVARRRLVHQPGLAARASGRGRRRDPRRRRHAAQDHRCAAGRARVRPRRRGGAPVERTAAKRKSRAAFVR